ncbi:MAG TPA: shikimate dehydrogenase [Firmicutes bacterium]|nr:shikimate dehydrogenase [Bacillota bacterium]
MGIDGETGLLCLLGHPVAHSLSPSMHNEAIRHMGLNLRYLAFDVTPDALGDAIRGIVALGITGANVTIPHKTAVARLMDSLATEAEMIGAVNTIVNDNGRLTGHNTDGYGLIASLREIGYDPRGEKVVMAGAGGAARACAVALALSGAREIVILNRTASRARDLVRHVEWAIDHAGMARSGPGTPGRRPGAYSLPLSQETIRKATAGASLFINATSIGLSDPDDCVMQDPDDIRDDMVICDLVYSPGRPSGLTRLIEIAGARGAKTVSGLSVLLYQGVRAFELWTGLDAPVEVMREALVRAAGRSHGQSQS